MKRVKSLPNWKEDNIIEELLDINQCLLLETLFNCVKSCLFWFMVIVDYIFIHRSFSP